MNLLALPLSLLILGWPAPRPRAAMERQAARLRRGWERLEKRGAAFIADPRVQAQVEGGGVAFDRAELFEAAARALKASEPGYSLMLEDPSGQPLAWAGRAQGVLPTDVPEGAVWSSRTVTFYRTIPISLAATAGWRLRLIEAWELPRDGKGFSLAPSGGISWHSGPGQASWGTVVSTPAASPAAENGRREEAAKLFFVIAFLVLILVIVAGPLRRISFLPSAVVFAAGCLGLAFLTPLERWLDPVDFFREPLTLAGFSTLTLAAVLLVPWKSAPGRWRWRGALALTAAGFFVGNLRPDCWWLVTLAFALALLSLLLVGGGPRRPIRVAVAGALAAAGVMGPLILWRQSRRAEAFRAERYELAAQAGTPQRILKRVAARLAPTLETEARLFQGTEEQDFSDFAFTLWKKSGLARQAPVSGLRLWHQGRLVSSFSSGISWDEADRVSVGGEQVDVFRRMVPLPVLAAFSVGVAPDRAEIEAGDWPVSRPLPPPFRDYRQLLLGSAFGAGAELPATSTYGEQLLVSFAAAAAALAVLLLLGLVGELWRQLPRPGARRVPLSFRGRITAIFTVLVLIPFVAVTVFIRQTLAQRLERETVIHAQTALTTARTVLDDYLSAAGNSPGRRQLIDDYLLSWMARAVGHDLSIYTDGRLYSTSRRELFSSGLLPERLDGGSLARILRSGGGSVVESRRLRGHAFDQVEAQLTSLPAAVTAAGPTIIAIPLLPEQRETEREIARLSASLTAFTLFVFGLSLLLGTRIAYRVTGPIGELVEATHDVARGKVPEISPPTDAELKRLVEAFETMAATLARQREELARGERLQAWAEMARMIAHEIKNPLTPIRLSAEHLLTLWERKDPEFETVMRACVNNILRQTDSLRAIASEFSDYARLPRPRMEEFPVRPLLEEASDSFSGATGLSWEIDVEPDLKIRADRRLLERAVANLIGNAREAAAPAGGIIRLRAWRHGSRVVVRVEDNGPGVAPADLKRLFEPYFSTKSGGTGLGLAIVRRIAQEHGGTVRAENLSPRGFAVEFDLEGAA